MNKHPQEIERRYLVNDLPRHPRRQTGERIEQGYLALSDLRTVRIRARGGTYYLTVKVGEGLVRHEVESRISKSLFNLLWPLTEGRRIEKTRYQLPFRGVTIELDVFRGTLAPLYIAEVEFPSVEASHAFQPPDWFGHEVTDDRAYSNVSLAIRGTPPRATHRCHVAAMPYLLAGDMRQIVVVTNRSGTEWMLPMREPEAGTSRHEAALLEAVQAAGALGSCADGTRSRCKLANGHRCDVYPLNVTILLKQWPEARLRQRRVLGIDDALNLITDKGLRGCIERLVSRLEGQP